MSSFGFEIGVSDVIAFIALVVSIVSTFASGYYRKKTIRREQASCIWAWIEPNELIDGMYDIVLSNQSGGLVYDVVATVVMRYGAGARDGRIYQGREMRVLLPSLKPGDRNFCVGHVDLSMFKTPGVELAFTDKFEASWIRQADGKLQRLRCKEGTLGYYGIPFPVDWTSRI